jgi:1,4-alpha-glucan branching enzyme
MKVDLFGIWEINLPAKGGVPVIPHGSKVKVPRSIPRSSYAVD